jgi:hypothetical protein
LDRTNAFPIPQVINRHAIKRKTLIAGQYGTQPRQEVRENSHYYMSKIGLSLGRCPFIGGLYISLDIKRPYYSEMLIVSLRLPLIKTGVYALLLS